MEGGGESMLRSSEGEIMLKSRGGERGEKSMLTGRI
jgi:hypothetical protein